MPAKEDHVPFDKAIYSSELKFNRKIFMLAHESFSTHYQSVFDSFNQSTNQKIPVVSDMRMYTTLRAITHDLLRYATYQVIEFDKKNDRFDICQSVRAAVFTKWIMMLRPYSLDTLSWEIEDKDDLRVITYCNEIAAAFYASTAMFDVLPSNAAGEPQTILDVLSPDEIQVMLYHLRHRLKHQDSYSLFYRRIKEQYVTVK
jgi:hypothetical protein